jgi:hypothetical protein
MLDGTLIPTWRCASIATETNADPLYNGKHREHENHANACHARCRVPVERVFAHLKRWPVLAKVRISPNRIGLLLKALFVVHRKRSSLARAVTGYDAATGFTALNGFREMLIARLGKGDNLTPYALIIHLAFGEYRAELDPADNDAAIDMLFTALDQFLDLRDKPGGLVRIYDDYLTWLIMRNPDRRLYQADSVVWCWSAPRTQMRSSEPETPCAAPTWGLS